MAEFNESSLPPMKLIMRNRQGYQISKINTDALETNPITIEIPYDAFPDPTITSGKPATVGPVNTQVPVYSKDVSLNK